jgi:hypothetical protein
MTEFEPFREFCKPIDKVSVIGSYCPVKIDDGFDMLVLERNVWRWSSHYYGSYKRGRCDDWIRLVGWVECHSLGSDRVEVGRSCAEWANDRTMKSNTLVRDLNNAREAKDCSCQCAAEKEEKETLTSATCCLITSYNSQASSDPTLAFFFRPLTYIRDRLVTDTAIYTSLLHFLWLRGRRQLAHIDFICGWVDFDSGFCFLHVDIRCRT